MEIFSNKFSRIFLDPVSDVGSFVDHVRGRGAKDADEEVLHPPLKARTQEAVRAVCQGETDLIRFTFCHELFCHTLFFILINCWLIHTLCVCRLIGRGIAYVLRSI